MRIVSRLTAAMKSPLLAAGVALAATAVAFGAPAQASTYRGIYVITPPLQNSTAPKLPNSFFTNPNIDGIDLQVLWGVVAPLPGSYNWLTIDSEIKAAVANNKKIDLTVIANRLITSASTAKYTTYSSPTWLFNEGVPALHFIAGPHAGLKECDEEVIAPPWNPTYQAAFTAFIAALANHLQTIPGAYDAVSLVKITGVSEITGETRLPSQTAPVAGHKCQAITNAVTTWKNAGYTPAKVIATWKNFAAAFNNAFPGKILADEMIAKNAFPPVDDSGDIVKITSATYVDVAQEIIADGIAMFPHRFAVQWDGLSSVQKTYAFNAVLKAAQEGAIPGWQTNNYLPAGTQAVPAVINGATLDHGTGCGGLVAEARGCDGVSYEAILNAGLAAGGQYLEVWPANASGFPAAIAETHAKMFPVASN